MQMERQHLCRDFFSSSFVMEEEIHPIYLCVCIYNEHLCLHIANEWKTMERQVSLLQ